MAVRKSSAEWKGTLKEGAGRMKVGTAWEGDYTHASRFESGPGTNPEELIGAALAGCYSMFLAALLSKQGLTPTSIRTTATVHLGEGPTINKIELDTEGSVPNVTDSVFQEQAEAARVNCPVSKALKGPEITLNAKLAK
ncbi:MAG TPA: OsmC family peroxiredoxin [Gemmatimonadaceae bacterium]|nr:OsmC family peroxiredoxin [Gemmatimonadaceae bacterium]